MQEGNLHFRLRYVYGVILDSSTKRGVNKEITSVPNMRTAINKINSQLKAYFSHFQTNDAVQLLSFCKHTCLHTFARNSNIIRKLCVCSRRIMPNRSHISLYTVIKFISYKFLNLLILFAKIVQEINYKRRLTVFQNSSANMGTAN